MLIKGKRYEWCMYAGMNMNDVPKKFLVNGLFTGEYAAYGKPIFMCKNGDRWAVFENHVREYQKRREKNA